MLREETTLINVARAEPRKASQFDSSDISFYVPRSYLITKRIFDIVASSLMIILLSPIFLISAIVIFIASGPSILFLQKRVGLHGKEFVIYKFRSMKGKIPMNSRQSVDENGYICKESNESRITIIGRFLRKSSIDELPQLFNVLKGNMSLVGPRPIMPEMTANYPVENRIRNMAKPGITGLWQVSARSTHNSILDMAPWDYEYIRKCSLSFDIQILLRTIPLVLTGKGAG